MSDDNHVHREPDAEPEEGQLCPCCLDLNNPAAHFCANCGAPLDAYAAIGPIESVYAQGFIYRTAANNPCKLIVLLGMWMIFGWGPFATPFVVVTLVRESIDINLLIGAFMSLVSVALLWKTTRNYFVKKRAHQKDNA